MIRNYKKGVKWVILVKKAKIRSEVLCGFGLLVTPTQSKIF